MRRVIAGFGIVAGGIMLASLAHAAIDLSPAEVVPEQPGAGRADLLKQWVGVGRCVVRRDRNAAIAFVTAPLGSEDSLTAARRLDPVFVGCLAGSRVPGPSSVVLRRAAIRNALGLRERT
jgi:hypothetical protein